jgi:hypothetical protein
MDEDREPLPRCEQSAASPRMRKRCPAREDGCVSSPVSATARDCLARIPSRVRMSGAIAWAGGGTDTLSPFAG